jgi:hypothetical protein
MCVDGVSVMTALLNIYSFIDMLILFCGYYIAYSQLL